MLLFVGLGNPGKAFAGNRHNVGFMALDAIARAAIMRRRSVRASRASPARSPLAGERVVLLKPQTYMNESGRAVGEAARFTRSISLTSSSFMTSSIFRRARCGSRPAAAMPDITVSDPSPRHFGNDYRRVRIGIGHPGDKALVHNYVLSDFAKADTSWVALYATRSPPMPGFWSRETGVSV